MRMYSPTPSGTPELLLSLSVPCHCCYLCSILTTVSPISFPRCQLPPSLSTKPCGSGTTASWTCLNQKNPRRSRPSHKLESATARGLKPPALLMTKPLVPWGTPPPFIMSSFWEASQLFLTGDPGRLPYCPPRMPGLAWYQRYTQNGCQPRTFLNTKIWGI